MTAKIIPFRTKTPIRVEEERLIEMLHKLFSNCGEAPLLLEDSDLLRLGHHLPLDDNNNPGD